MVVCVIVVLKNFNTSNYCLYDSTFFYSTGSFLPVLYYLTGLKKEIHEFKRLATFDSLDAVVSYLMSCSDGRFRLVRRAGKRFLPTLT